MGSSRRDRSWWRSILDDDDFAKSTIAIDLLDLTVLHRVSGRAFPLAGANRWCGLYARASCIGINGAIDGLVGILGHNLGRKRVDRCRHCLRGGERRGGRGERRTGENLGACRAKWILNSVDAFVCSLFGDEPPTVVQFVLSHAQLSSSQHKYVQIPKATVPDDEQLI